VSSAVRPDIAARAGRLGSPRLDSAGPSLYSDFLDFISDRDVYEVHTVEEYDSAYDSDRVNILLRHDVDYSDGLDMAKMDYDMGFRSTNYLRVYSDLIPAAPPEYRIEEVAPTWQWFAEHGRMEIGYHYDVMDETTQDFTKPTNLDQARELFGQNVSFLRNYFDIRTVSAHGGTYNYLYERGEYEREINLEPYGVVSAAYLPYSQFPPAHYFAVSDVDGQLDYLRAKLLERGPGDVVQVLIHPYSRRWAIADFVSPIDNQQPTQSPATAVVPDTAPNLPASSGPVPDSRMRPAPLAAAASGTTSGGLSPRLGLLALAPAALLMVAVWRYRRAKTLAAEHCV